MVDNTWLECWGNNRSATAEGSSQRCNKGLHAYEIVLQHVKAHSAHRIGCCNNAKAHSDPPNGLLQHVKDHSAHRMGCCNMQKTIQTL